MKTKAAQFIATFGYSGYFPKAPGSFASALGVGFCYLLKDNLPLYVGIFVALNILGWWASDVMEKDMGQKDPGCVVIDEIVGVMITFFFIPMTTATMWIGFFLFRAFDMFKVYPGNKLEELGGATGIMADDLLAGVYANVILHVAIRLLPLI